MAHSVCVQRGGCEGSPFRKLPREREFHTDWNCCTTQTTVATSQRTASYDIAGLCHKPLTTSTPRVLHARRRPRNHPFRMESKHPAAWGRDPCRHSLPGLLQEVWKAPSRHTWRQHTHIDTHTDKHPEEASAASSRLRAAERGYYTAEEWRLVSTAH